MGDFIVMHDLDDLADDFLAALKALADAAGINGPEPPAPWPGYDEQTVPVIAEHLNGTSDDLAAAVRTYELAHKQRRGIITPTQRRPPSTILGADYGWVSPCRPTRG